MLLCSGFRQRGYVRAACVCVPRGCFVLSCLDFMCAQHAQEGRARGLLHKTVYRCVTSKLEGGEVIFEKSTFSRRRLEVEGGYLPTLFY